MKRIFIICLACLMLLALAVGCNKGKTDGDGAQDGAQGEAAVVETTEIVRLESIDYDEASKGLVLHLTNGAFTPSTTDVDTDYTIEYGETVTMPLAADATIDFPMADDLTKTVTITSDELTEEFLAFLEQYDDKPLFIVEQAGDAVKKLTYFYLP